MSSKKLTDNNKPSPSVPASDEPSTIRRKRVPTSAGGEVPLGLEREECQADGDRCSDASCHDDSILLVEGAHGPQHEALAHYKQDWAA